MNQNFFRKLIYSVGGQRFTQDSPIMPDVWLHLGANPTSRLPVLLTPYQGVTPAELAQILRLRLDRAGSRSQNDKGPRVAYNQTVVVADLLFDELIQVAIPMSAWWIDYLFRGAGHETVMAFTTVESDDTRLDREELRQKLVDAFLSDNYVPRSEEDLPVDIVWLCRVVGTIALLKRYATKVEISGDKLVFKKRAKDTKELSRRDLQSPRRLRTKVVQELFRVINGILPPITGENGNEEKTLWCVNRNRSTTASLFDSAPAVKADATQRLFEVEGRNITWAVLDSGIDARHTAFRERDEQDKIHGKPFEKVSDDITGQVFWTNRTRIKATYDLSCLRDLLSAEKADELPDKVRAQLKNRTKKDIDGILKQMRTGNVIDWDWLRPFIQIPHRGPTGKGEQAGPEGAYRAPVHPHGTHVAGIIGADWRPEDQDPEATPKGFLPDTTLTGVAPSVKFIDVRVLNDDGSGDEFSMMAGLQFVRHLNMIHEQRQVHGVNLSFSLRHDFTTFACGQTPICQECERLVNEGTVVVAAAGNEGIAQYVTVAEDTGIARESTGYRSISITDPGNAESVITVGATHRRDPHTYGVSYFSSRGPTGDGRRKPDLVAPGEKITSTWPNLQFGEMDGTSQAAPHVSGAAALLLERNPEMIGNPDRVKKILCDTATDLGREHYFQGAGMIDILRALQSI